MERLDKLLAGTGKWSRREVKALVRQGLVRVDGRLAASAEDKLDPAAAIITVAPPMDTPNSTISAWGSCSTRVFTQATMSRRSGQPMPAYRPSLRSWARAAGARMLNPISLNFKANRPPYWGMLP